jgi:hypothetical protein
MSQTFSLCLVPVFVMMDFAIFAIAFNLVKMNRKVTDTFNNTSGDHIKSQKSNTKLGYLTVVFSHRKNSLTSGCFYFQGRDLAAQ